MNIKKAILAISVVALIAAAAWGAGQIKKSEARQIAKQMTETPSPAARIRIDSVVREPRVGRKPRFIMGGVGFGAQQGSRQIVTPAGGAFNSKTYLTWSDTSIAFELVEDIKFGVNYPFTIEGGGIISDQFRTTFLIDWKSISPVRAPPGTKIALQAWGPGPSPRDDWTLMMEGYSDKGAAQSEKMKIVGWKYSGGGPAVEIVSEVPVIAKGNYKIFLKGPGYKVSQEQPFTVQFREF